MLIRDNDKKKVLANIQIFCASLMNYTKEFDKQKI